MQAVVFNTLQFRIKLFVKFMFQIHQAPNCTLQYKFDSHPFKKKSVIKLQHSLFQACLDSCSLFFPCQTELIYIPFYEIELFPVRFLSNFQTGPRILAGQPNIIFLMGTCFKKCSNKSVQNFLRQLRSRLMQLSFISEIVFRFQLYKRLFGEAELFLYKTGSSRPFLFFCPDQRRQRYSDFTWEIPSLDDGDEKKIPTGI